MKQKFVFLVLCIFLAAGCNSNDHMPDQLSVRVIDANGAGIANVTVFTANQSGQMTSVSSTDDNGNAYFDSVLPDSIVAAASSCYYASYDRIYYTMDIVYEVNTQEILLTLGGCDENSPQITFNVTDAVAGIADREVTLGPITYSGSGATIGVYELQDDGNISAFATGYDDTGNVMGYGFALDQPAIDGSAITVAIDRTDFVKHTHVFQNVPADTVSYIMDAPLIRKHASTYLSINCEWGAAPMPGAMDSYSFTGFADSNQFYVSASVDQDSDGNADANVGLIRYLENVTDQVFDFSSVPAIPDSLVFDPGTDGRPLITWNGNDSSATVQKLTLSYRADLPERVSYICTITVPASVETVQFSELPDTLADFGQVEYSDLSLETLKFDGSTTYEYFLEDMAYYNGRFYEEETLSSYSYSRIE